MTIDVVEGDITSLQVDVVVNAANTRLAGGGGVDGAIHRAAGSADLQRACRAIGGCPTGEVRVTPAFRLPARAIYHTVGPVWQGGAAGEEALLRSCYRHCLQQLIEDQLQSIVFPAISCGVYGFPPQLAVPVAVAEARRALRQRPDLGVIFCCFDSAMADLYRQALSAPS
ncbi:macro domain-containing protein [Pseudomaricurvus sp. HS19]|uniref:macro domain-containing protein n=1 Tax=Pseudomaricurvus sp. HS19 TaxID=2692626 RepID=UPI001371929A|nr:macro domain-containing protein [Pseudomaricurvus sp. HS19]MYM62552.1 O-acetyl-ADP-ribose deacetylase [Pseudomaricurvus sp. HS19]